MAPAVATISGKGTRKVKIAINATAAVAFRAGVSSVRDPSRITACSTIASTAALRADEGGGDRLDVAIEDIEPAQRHDRNGARKDEQPAGDQPAARPVQQPPDIGRELLRLGSGQEHAEVESMQELRVVEPTLLFQTMRCIIAICPAGPPNDSSPIRAQVRVASPFDGAGRRSFLIGLPARGALGQLPRTAKRAPVFPILSLIAGSPARACGP